MGKDKWTRREVCSDDDMLVLDDPEEWRTARVTVFGCVEYTRILKRDPPENQMTIHICDVDDEIERLQQLKDQARQHFRVWPPRAL